MDQSETQLGPEGMRVFRGLLAAKALANAAAVPLHKHDAFDDLRGRLQFMQLGVAALKGIGALLQPETRDQQLNQAFSSDAAAVFSFFAEALEEPATGAYDDMERLERAARGELV